MRIQQGLLGQREWDTTGHSHPHTAVQQGRSEENKHCGLSVLPELPRPLSTSGWRACAWVTLSRGRPPGQPAGRPADLGGPSHSDQLGPLAFLCQRTLLSSSSLEEADHPRTLTATLPRVPSLSSTLQCPPCHEPVPQTKPLSAYTARWLCFLQGRQSLSNRRGDGRPHPDLY